MGQDSSGLTASLARDLIRASEHEPDVIKSLLYAFDRAWADNARAFSDESNAGLAQLMIAEAILALAGDGQRNMVSLYVCAAARARDLAANTAKSAQ